MNFKQSFKLMTYIERNFTFFFTLKSIKFIYFFCKFFTHSFAESKVDFSKE